MASRGDSRDACELAAVLHAAGADEGGGPIDAVEDEGPAVPVDVEEVGGHRPEEGLVLHVVAGDLGVIGLLVRALAAHGDVTD